MITRFLIVLFILSSCQEKTSTLKTNLLNYTTLSDSCLFYYQKGWQQIMDDGDYSGAEVSYRQALEFDPDFLLGQAVLARLTLDPVERQILSREIMDHKDQVFGKERLLLDVYASLISYTTLRDDQDTNAAQALDEALNLGLRNLGAIVKAYPAETYIKAEYIEIIHSIYGAQASLDSLDHLLLDVQENNPFLLGYRASLQAELGDFQSAQDNADKLEAILGSSGVAKPHAVYADIYMRMEKWDQAQFHADKAVSIDPRNLDASRLKEKIDKHQSEIK